MKSFFVALAIGLVFGAGLCISGMTLPSKVQGFLDVSGTWDASLALVMVGAIALHAAALRVVRTRTAPVLAPQFHAPSLRVIRAPLVLGSALFGIGWGISGYCPGPAIVSLACGSLASVVFVAAMATSMLGYRVVEAKLAKAAPPQKSHAPS